MILSDKSILGLQNVLSAFFFFLFRVLKLAVPPMIRELLLLIFQMGHLETVMSTCKKII